MIVRHHLATNTPTDSHKDLLLLIVNILRNIAFTKPSAIFTKNAGVAVK